MIKILMNNKTIFILLLLLLFIFGYGEIRSNRINEENKKEAQVLNKQETEKRLELDRIKDNLPSMTCWGDSLTMGAGGDGTTYPNVLAKLTGLTVYNMGVGGEDTKTIACRQGSRTMMVNNITIPATTTNVEIGSYDNFYDNLGEIIAPLRQGDGGINICSIAGIEGNLSVTQTDSASKDTKYYFERLKAGEEVSIKEATPIVTNASIERKDDITIIFIGQNGGYINIDDLISQQKDMIKYTGHDKYIILGLTSGSTIERTELESRMEQEYGDKYINLRDYLSNYGLKDAGITATSVDEEQIKQGIVPDSLRSDNVHGNKYFYELIGKQIYNKLIELNYLNDKQKDYLGISNTQ